MMKLERVVLVGFVVAVAVTCGLTGFWLGASQEASAMNALSAPVGLQADKLLIQADPVAMRLQNQIRLYAGPTPKSPVAYTIQGDKVWVGPDTTTASVYTVQGEHLMRSFSNEIQYTLSGNRIYRGSNVGRDAAYTLVGHRVYHGESTTSQPLLSFVGNRVHWGAGTAGRVMMTANVIVEGNPTLEFLLPILLLERF